MTHELKDIFKAFEDANSRGEKSVMATVVHLEGSSYRKPGVRMLLLENGQMVGAVSGGCVEKDIQRQAATVFDSGKAKMMTYDGRYRLGCEGILYILIEPFSPSTKTIDAFWNAVAARQNINIKSLYQTKEGEYPGMGSFLDLAESYPVMEGRLDALSKNKNLEYIDQSLAPCFKLMIFGAEHDAVILCKMAALNGWEVSVIAGPLESKSISNFPGATAFFSVSPDDLELDSIDEETAIVLMSHNFANDLKYLIEIKDSQPAYLGLLGPKHRREKLLAQFLEYHPDTSPEFLDQIHGPAGLDLGAETPSEIALSILAEVLSVWRKRSAMPLRHKEGGIHA